MDHRCLNGHPLQHGFAFCPRCGAAAQAQPPATAHPAPGVGEESKAGDSPTPPAGAEHPAAATAYTAHPSQPDERENPLRNLHAPLLSHLSTRRGRVIATAAAALVVVAVAGAWTGLIGGKHTINGRFDLIDSESDWTALEPCSGSGGYDDVKPGAQVLVLDGDDHVLGRASLSPGVAEDVEDIEGTDDDGGWFAEHGVRDDPTDDSSTCIFEFEVEGIPTSDFYKVSVADRGEMVYSHDDLSQSDWTVGLTLGQ